MYGPLILGCVDVVARGVHHAPLTVREGGDLAAKCAVGIVGADYGPS